MFETELSVARGRRIAGRIASATLLAAVWLGLSACAHHAPSPAPVSALPPGPGAAAQAPGQGAADAQVQARARPPVRPWERGYLSRRAMRFDDGLEAWFNQHMFGSREGADGAYGMVGGGCGCN